MTNDAERLQLVTSINNSFQTNIQHADAKAGILAVACSGMVTAMLSQGDAVREALHRVGFLLGGGLAIWAVLLAVSVGQLARAVRPRTKAPSSGNHFAFAAVATSSTADIRHVPADVLCAEGAELGVVLAGIADHKYRAVGTALKATTRLAALTMACLTLTAMVS